MPTLDISSVSGLTGSEAERKLQQEGYNELPTTSKRGLFRIVVEVIHEPMFLLLVGGGLIYFILGDVTEGLMLMSFVVVIIGITVYQERKTERALEALRNLSSPRALVMIRDGVQQRIPGREVVTGDMVILSEGDRVPADGILLMSNNVSVDESLLTGESVPVRKNTWKDGMQVERPGGDDQPSVFSGTLVVSGQGLVQVIPVSGQKWGRSEQFSRQSNAVRHG
jgi:Ca2+-transporting ATPase